MVVAPSTVQILHNGQSPPGTQLKVVFPFRSPESSEKPMNQIQVGSQLTYQVNAPATFLFNISVSRNAFQRIVAESLEILPFQKIEECAVGDLGNRMIRISANQGELTVKYQATVELDVAVADSTDVGEMEYEMFPEDVLAYLNPSRYCESDKLMRLAADEFGHLLQGYSRVTAICNWVYDLLTYSPGSTGPTTTACDVLLQRTGVCRDYAHVSISLCRALGIPARYVSGYAVNLQPPDFHGFFEAYLDGRWFLFDATRLAPVGGFVRIGTGRDAADVAIATIRGNAIGTSMEVWTKQQGQPDELIDVNNVRDAVSSS